MATGTIFPDGDISTTNWIISPGGTFFTAVSDGNPGTFGYSQTTGALLVMSMQDISFPAGHGLQSMQVQAQLSVDAGMAGRVLLLDGSNNVLASSGYVTGANVVTMTNNYVPPLVVPAATANLYRIGIIADTAAAGQFVRVMDNTQATYSTVPAGNNRSRMII
jgi:hypothetical protein